MKNLLIVTIFLNSFSLFSQAGKDFPEELAIKPNDDLITQLAIRQIEQTREFVYPESGNSFKEVQFVLDFDKDARLTSMKYDFQEPELNYDQLATYRSSLNAEGKSYAYSEDNYSYSENGRLNSISKVRRSGVFDGIILLPTRVKTTTEKHYLTDGRLTKKEFYADEKLVSTENWFYKVYESDGVKYYVPEKIETKNATEVIVTRILIRL